MLPTWVGVVLAVSLAVLALAGVVLAAVHYVAARRAEQFVVLVEQLAGPALQDVRQLVGVIRAEAESVAGTSRDLRLRLVHAADAAEARLNDVDALLDVVQQEVEDTVLDVGATLRKARRGLTLWRWGKRLLKRPARPARRRR